MITWPEMKLEPMERAAEAESKIKIPWEEIDKWLATVDLKEEIEGRKVVLDSGDRRN